MSSLSSHVDAFVAEVRERWEVPGVAVAIVRRDGPLHVHAYGVSSVTSSAPADVDTTFAIGSCSKAFTSGLAAALVDAGKIDWDDPIRKYLPSFQLYDPWISDRVTLRDLLANRTGLSRASVGEYGSDLSRAELLHQARYIQPIAGFRDQFTYCNVGYAAAAEAMALTAGHPFDHVMDEYLRRPLGVTPSTVSEVQSTATSNVAAPHYKVAGKVQVVPPMSTDNLSGAIGQAMSARDAARWLAFHLDEGTRQDTRLVSPQQLRETHLLQVARRDQAANDGYGFGWHVRNRRIQHDGAVRGFRTNIWCDLAGGLGIFVTTNLGSGFAQFAITNRIIQAIRGEAVTDWIAHFDEMAKGELNERIARFDKERFEEPVSTSRWRLDDFIGNYQHEGFGSLHIEPRNDHLWFRIDGLSGFDGPLVRYSDLSFEYQGDRDAMAWPAIAAAEVPRGERAQVRFRAAENEIDGLCWSDWFGDAKFIRIT
ncbi:MULTISPECIES: serine hydrolase [unclassified Bradyrhizobium]|uniref:serine hydrolase n=1 Tax=unclassified Bradyrhizobium TaxID=2631580 RepID=UPI001BA4B187|nr:MULTISPECIES: serine hydrolase [unclassified Bradyrhizobium]MBR1226910.1 serine hydrolase [Bradyrhizobium sp. AUGA SZCCT0176]MBR1296745.1 serine hydrolase [Bradyrhizobium sp. AUGA SZCCT0042]